MVDLMDEVAEEIRHERMVKMLKFYGPIVAIVVISILTLTGAYVGWQSYKSGQIKELSTRYYKAINLPASKKKEQLAFFEALASENKESYGVLSRFQMAQLQEKMAPSKVVDIFINIVKKTDSPEAIKRAAQMMAILNQFDNLTDEKAQALIMELESIQRASPSWDFIAKFSQAHLLIYLNRLQEAIGILTLLSSDALVPEEIASLSKAYLGAYKSGAVK